MKFELFVALRYLRAKRKQAVVSVVTFISVLGVAAGVIALIVALSMSTGFQAEFQRRILGVTSHVNLLGAGGTAVTGFEDIRDKSGSWPEVISVTPTVYGECLLQSPGRQEPAMLKGIGPENREELQKLLPKLREGSFDRFLQPGSIPPIVLGKDLANALVVSAGEQVQALGFQGEISPLGRMPRIQRFEVAAIFESGLWDFDANWALVPLPAAQKFLGLSTEQVSAIEFKIRDIYQAPQFAEKLRTTWGPGYSTSTWIELNRPLFSALKLEKLAMFIAIGLIVLVAALNIVGSLILMVMEKGGDIAIMTAMGGTKRLITRIFMFQGLLIGVIGTLLGDVIGIVAVWYLDRYRVFQLEPQVYSIPYVPFHLSWSDVIIVSVVAVFISFAATLYPARAASRLDPVEALRYE